MPDHLIDQQIAYYRARASEYDQWFLRQGRYDRGEQWNLKWFSEVDDLRSALSNFSPRGHVLELACGTGLWTEVLSRTADTLTALDASPEVIAINRGRLEAKEVRYIQTDLLSWEPDRLYDVVFFSFWLSHVPPDLFNDFWSLVFHSLKPGGRVFFIDSLDEPTSKASNHDISDEKGVTETRKLNDGREFEIVKIFYDPQLLKARLDELGWSSEIGTTETYFLYGSCQRSSTSKN